MTIDYYKNKYLDCAKAYNESQQEIERLKNALKEAIIELEGLGAQSNYIEELNKIVSK